RVFHVTGVRTCALPICRLGSGGRVRGGWRRGRRGGWGRPIEAGGEVLVRLGVDQQSRRLVATVVQRRQQCARPDVGGGLLEGGEIGRASGRERVWTGAA